MLYRVKCLRGFLDGNVFPRYINPEEIVEVPESTWNKMKSSDPEGFEVVSKIVPPPRRVEEKPAVQASPGARILAQEKGVSLRSVRGTGKSGYVTKRDVEATIDD